MKIFFCGNYFFTANKFNGLIYSRNQMSEDLDFKVGLSASTSRSHLRKNLGLLRDQIVEILQVEGFEIIDKYSDNQN